jgi:hypothetical protein
MTRGIALVFVAAAVAGTTMLVSAQGWPLLDADDLAFLHRHLGIAPQGDIVCTMTAAESARLHRLIKAGDLPAVKAYVDNVTLDQLADESSHIGRTNRCPPSAR